MTAAEVAGNAIELDFIHFNDFSDTSTSSVENTQRRRHASPESRKRKRSPSPSSLFSSNIIAPWLTFDYPRQHDRPARILHHEIRDYVRYIQPTPNEHLLRGFVIYRVQHLVAKIWPGSETSVFGSFHTKLYLPSSDIDMVVFLPGENAGPVSKNVLYKLGTMLKTQNISHDVTVVAHARVPIVKFREKYTQIHVDISFNVDSGLKTAKTTRKFLNAYPGLKEIVVIVKSFLKQRDMNEVYQGGLGSYAITLLSVSFLQRHPELSRGDILAKDNLGVLLIEFFELYGKLFAFDRIGIRVAPHDGQYFQKPPPLFSDRHRSGFTHSIFTPCIIDPEDDENDVGRGSYGILRVRQAFAQAYEILTTMAYDLFKGKIAILNNVKQKQQGYTILSRILKVEASEVRRRKEWEERVIHEAEVKKALPQVELMLLEMERKDQGMDQDQLHSLAKMSSMKAVETKSKTPESVFKNSKSREPTETKKKKRKKKEKFVVDVHSDSD